MSQAVSQNDVLQDLSYLLGETSVPNPVPADRQAFIQRTLERIYRMYDFTIFKAITNATLTAGTVNLPTDARLDPDLDIRTIGSGMGDDLIYKQIPYEQQDSFGAGDYRYWLTGNPGTYVVNTTETTTTAPVKIRYSQDAPTINASITTPFPSSMAIARGALVYYRGAEDPQADVSQLDAQFKQEVEEVIAEAERNKKGKTAVTRHQFQGTYTGSVEG